MAGTVIASVIVLIGIAPIIIIGIVQYRRVVTHNGILDFYDNM